jgi:single-stranded DNA-binding protein
VEGRLRIETYQTEEGERRKVAEVVARTVQFLDRRGAPLEPKEIPPEEGEEEVPF